jgi:hypothetical protein
MDDKSVIIQRYNEAKNAYHALNTGSLAKVIVDQNGERVEFNTANRANLYQYIKELETELGMSNANAYPPLQFIF